MLISQRGIPTTEVDDEPKEQNVGSKKDEKVDESSVSDSDYDNKSVKVNKKGKWQIFHQNFIQL
jgi:hypothetical protein